MNQKQIEMCNTMITNLSESIANSYKRIEYLEKYVDKDFDENEYDSYSDYESNITQLENELRLNEIKITDNESMIIWLKHLKNT